MTNTKMFLFARWITTCYGEMQIDDKGLSNYETGFDKTTAIFGLNRLDGKWWKDKLSYFNDVVYPNYKKNGSVKDTKEFLKELK